MAFEDLHRPLGPATFRGATRWIIILSGAVLLLQQFFGQYMEPVFGLVPIRFWQSHWIWQPFTYLFLHGGIFHWLFNMVVLWMFGRELEVRWGTFEFVKFFFICGLGAALCVLLLSPNSSAPTIGASGAIFGFLVAFAMVFPEATLYLYFVIPVKAWQAAALFAFIEFFAALSAGGVGLARFAHLGGMLTGYLYLRFGWQVGHTLASPWQGLRSVLARRRQRRANTSVEFHEVTDDLVKEVDRILEKILKDGVDSLTSQEKKLMDRYSRLKR